MHQLLSPTFAASLVLAVSQVVGGVVPLASRAPETYSQPGGSMRVAVNATNTPGDANNSFIISEPGSYYLSGDMVGETGKVGIRINADDVSLDLMGFQMLGVPGSSDGILAGAQEGILVRNGSVRGFGQTGVDLTAGRGSGVERVRASENGSSGIQTGAAGWIRLCTSVQNDINGFLISNGGVIETSTAWENGATGFVVGPGGRAIDCIAQNNATHGFIVNDQGTLVGCTAEDNGWHGFRLQTEASAVNCVASQNGLHGFHGEQAGVGIDDCRAMSNGEFGFLVKGESVLRRNHARGNGGVGVGGGFRIEGLYTVVEDNVAVGNPFMGYSTSQGGSFFKRNQAGNNALNWSVTTGNAVHVIHLNYAPAVFGVAGGGMSVSTDPNANSTF